MTQQRKDFDKIEYVLGNDTAILSVVSAKKLPKNEQSTGQGAAGQGRRLADGDTGAKATGNCCKWWSPLLVGYVSIINERGLDCAAAL